MSYDLVGCVDKEYCRGRVLERQERASVLKRYVLVADMLKG